jgi:hypothetical protein
MPAEGHMTPKMQNAGITFKLIKDTEAKPPQRFGRETIEGSLVYREFLEAVNSIGPHQYGDFTGAKKNVQSYRRKVIKYIKEHKLPLHVYVITNDNESQTLYVCG